METATITINDPPARLRVAGPRGAGSKVEREAGDYGAGLIRDFSVITRGEALGHSLWIDRKFLDQVASAGRAAEGGIKSRFTHPGLSGDGLGKAIGRAKNFRRRGDQVIADLHLLESSKSTPDGNLGDYLMDLAEEDPQAFGASIVFMENTQEMGSFQAEYTDDQGRFISPDEDNKMNFPHARLAKLSAADMVGDPAANEAGLFSAFTEGSELAARAEIYAAYALGLSDEKPDDLAGPHPDRARTFLQGFLARRGYALTKIGADDPQAGALNEPEITSQISELRREFDTLRRMHAELKAYVLGRR